MRALEDDKLADQLVDDLLDLLQPPNEKEVAHALQSAGITPERLNELADKTAGFGDALKNLKGFLVRPFLNLGRLFTSSKFRGQVKSAFRKSLSHEYRATRHALDVYKRLRRKEKVPPQEVKAAMRQLLSILINVVIAVAAGPGVSGLFSGSLLKAFQVVAIPIRNILSILLRQPLQDAAAKLMFARA